MNITYVGRTKVLKWLENATERIVTLVGGSGSSKSYSIAQHLILNKMCQEEDIRILVVRKTSPAVKTSCYQLVIDLLNDYKIHYELNKTEMKIIIGNNQMIFRGFDDVEKLKSIEFCNYIWIEEATEIKWEDFMQLNLRLRRRTRYRNQFFLSFNPISSLHWLKKRLIDQPPKSFELNHSTYKDNPFLDEDTIIIIEELKEQDTNFYNIYALGLWGLLKNIIYSPRLLIPVNEISFFGSTEEEIAKAKYKVTDISFGFDVGYNNPSCLQMILWLENKKFISHQLFYEKHLQNNDVIDRFKSYIPEHLRNKEVFVDPSEAGLIDLLLSEGFNVHKAKNAVKDGINYCKVNHFAITLNSTETITEIQTYSYKEDKDGNVLEEPIKFNDHAMDSIRYGSYSKSQVMQATNKLTKSFR